MKLHFLALFLLVSPQLGGVLDRLRSDANAQPETPRAAVTAIPAQPQPSPSPVAPPSSNR